MIPINIEDEMKRSYLDYAMSVIVGRALPDVRDGLKPVHRRILYMMHEMGLHFNRPTKKSARVVGDVMGKLHPHGDSADFLVGRLKCSPISCIMYRIRRCTGFKPSRTSGRARPTITLMA